MAFTVRTLPRAETDAQHIYSWIYERSPEGALRWWQAFEEACSGLRERALIHGPAPEASGGDRDVRHVLFKTPHGSVYRALYVVVGAEVRVLRIRGPGQPVLADDELD